MKTKLKLQHKGKFKLGNYSPSTISENGDEISGTYYTEGNMCRVYTCYFKNTGWHVGIAVYKNEYSNDFNFRSNKKLTERALKLLATKYSKIVNADPFYSEQTIDPITIPVTKPVTGWDNIKPLRWKFWK